MTINNNSHSNDYEIVEFQKPAYERYPPRLVDEMSYYQIGFYLSSLMGYILVMFMFIVGFSYIIAYTAPFSISIIIPLLYYREYCLEINKYYISHHRSSKMTKLQLDKKLEQGRYKMIYWMIGLNVLSYLYTF
jgi:hypothetical protein